MMPHGNPHASHRAEYPKRRSRNGHSPDCPYAATHQARTCPCCQGERKAARDATAVPAPRRPKPPPGVPPTPVDLTDVDRPGELTSCPSCFAPVDAGQPCSRCPQEAVDGP